MANYKGTDTDLIAVANAIRGKAETSASLMWPNEYITEIQKLKKNPFPYPNIKKNLNENSWQDISQIAGLGIADQVWDIGDCKEITLNGTIGTLSLNNYTTNIFILDFNYPDPSTDKNIIFCGFKTNGVNVGIVDSYYGQSGNSGSLLFNMNHTGAAGSSIIDGRHNGNAGGWRASDFRYDILGATSSPPTQYKSQKHDTSNGYDATQATITNPVPNTLMSTLPSDFRNILKLQNRYIATFSSLDSSYRNVIDAISLRSAYECDTTTINTIGPFNCSVIERNYNYLFKYYKAGNSNIHKKHNDLSTTAGCWLASPSTSVDHLNRNSNIFCATGKDLDDCLSSVSLGIVPIFKV